jgi:hypothetical protein
MRGRRAFGNSAVNPVAFCPGLTVAVAATLHSVNPKALR